MADPIGGDPGTLLDLLKLGGGSVGGGGLVGAIMWVMRNKAEQAIAMNLALLNQRFEQLDKRLEKHEATFEDVVKLRMEYQALHRRLEHTDAEIEDLRRGK